MNAKTLRRRVRPHILARMALKDLIRQERKRLDMTQVEFASALGVDQTYVSKWERGQRPNTENAGRLAKLTGRPLTDFLPTPPARAKRASIDAVVAKFGDDDWQLVYDFAVDLRDSGGARSGARGPAGAVTGKQKRARSTGSAPAA